MFISQGVPKEKREVIPSHFNLWREKERELEFNVDSKYNLEEIFKL